VPELQHFALGQWVPMAQTPSDATTLKVDSFEIEQWLLWRKPDSTWAWALTDLGNGQTRLVTRRPRALRLDETGSGPIRCPPDGTRRLPDDAQDAVRNQGTSREHPQRT
jgi:hypothetical protein